MTLVAAAILPLALAVCAAAVLSAKAHGGCSLSQGTSGWLAGGLYLFALVLALRLLWVAVRVARKTRAVAVRGAAARLAERLPVADGEAAFVLPLEEPLAYTTGLGRGQIVVSRGLLELLDDDERQALLAHELAHLRGGHQRILYVANVVASALAFLRPVRSAFVSLRRHLEAAADERAVATVGDRRIVARAIAKAALASAPASLVPSAGGADLRYRLERLLAPPPPSRPATLAAALGGMLVAAALVVSVCLALHVGALPANVALCLGILAALALPPLLRSRGVASVLKSRPG